MTTREFKPGDCVLHVDGGIAGTVLTRPSVKGTCDVAIPGPPDASTGERWGIEEWSVDVMRHVDEPAEAPAKRKLRRCKRCGYDTDRLIEGMVCFPCYNTPMELAGNPLVIHSNRVANMVMDLMIDVGRSLR